MCVCVCVYVCVCFVCVCVFCVCVCDTVQTVYELPLLPNNTAVKHSYTNREQCEVLMDIYHWGAGLAVTGRIRDIRQNVYSLLSKQE